MYRTSCATRAPSVAPFLGISWSLLFQQLRRNMLELNVFGLVTNPQYYVQRRAVMSDDGLGWTWQCNVLYWLFCQRLIILLSSSSAGLEYMEKNIPEVQSCHQSEHVRRRGVGLQSLLFFAPVAWHAVQHTPNIPFTYFVLLHTVYSTTRNHREGRGGPICQESPSRTANFRSVYLIFLKLYCND